MLFMIFKYKGGAKIFTLFIRCTIFLLYLRYVKIYTDTGRVQIEVQIIFMFFYVLSGNSFSNIVEYTLS